MRILPALGVGLLILFTSCQSHTKTGAPGGLQTVTVRTVTLKERQVQPTLVTNGNLAADQDVVVKAETQGKLVSVSAQVGDRVSLGQILAVADDTMKKAALEANQASFTKLSKDLARVTDLVNQGASTPVEQDSVHLAVDTARSQVTIAGKDLENTRIRSPFTGVVTESWVNVGTMVSPGTSVFHVISLDQLKVTVNVNERYILQVKPGMEVSLSPEADPQLVLKGRVRSVSPQSVGSQNFPVEIGIANKGAHPLMAGMSVKIQFNLGSRTIRAIPRSALIGSVQEPQVFVVEGKTAVRKSIQAGEQYDTDLEVLGGLNPGDQVIVNGQNLVDDHMSVEVAP